jgi:hypothetical protein
VPYVELVAKGSSVTGLKWCFVDPSASTKALKKQETSQPAKVIKIMIIPDKGKNLFEKEIDQVFADGEIMEGNLTFTSPIKAEKINRVRVDFAYDDARTEYVQTTYTWRFFTQGRK